MHRDQIGRNRRPPLNVPAENFVIRNCTMRDGHGGVTVGSEISGGCRNVFGGELRDGQPELKLRAAPEIKRHAGGTRKIFFMRNVSVGLVKNPFCKLISFTRRRKGKFQPVARIDDNGKHHVAQTPAWWMCAVSGGGNQRVRICN